MFDKNAALTSIRKVIQDEEALTKAVLYAIEKAYNEHDQTKGLTKTASQSSSWVGGWVASTVRFATSYQPVQDWMTSNTHKKRLENAIAIADDLRSKKISAIEALWRIGQEGHWSEGGVVYTPSFNTKAMRYFILFSIEHCHGEIAKDDVLKDDSSGIDRESKNIYQSIIDENILTPELSIQSDVRLTSSGCANLLLAMSHSSYSDIFTQAILSAGERAYLEFKGTGTWQTYNYQDRLSNTNEILTKLKNGKITSVEAFRRLADEGEWNKRPNDSFNSYNTMFIAYLVEWLAKNLPKQNILNDESLYTQIKKLPDDKRYLFSITKSIYSDYMHESLDTYKKNQLALKMPAEGYSSVPSLPQQYSSPPPQMHTTQQPPPSMMELYATVLGGKKTTSYQPQYPRSSFFTTGNQFDSHQPTSSYTSGQ
ncbi:hypothetical protein L3V83_02575 [Thiotrichales bacterium 19X7-9]|nr:hypothetical protein [Thiotrichales bacterium 19X7-9]